MLNSKGSSTTLEFHHDNSRSCQVGSTESWGPGEADLMLNLKQGSWGKPSIRGQCNINQLLLRPLKCTFFSNLFSDKLWDYRENILPGPSQALCTQLSSLRLWLPLDCLKWILTEATCSSHLRWPCRQYWVRVKSGTSSKTFGKKQAVLKLLNWLHSGFFASEKGANGFPNPCYAPRLLLRF